MSATKIEELEAALNEAVEAQDWDTVAYIQSQLML